MFRILIIVGVLAVLLATFAQSAAMTGTSKMLGGSGDSSVPHCQVTTSPVTVASDAITATNPTVECDQTGTYTVQSTVAAGASSSTNSNSIALTANTPAAVSITVSPSVSISAETSYTVTYEVTV